MRPNTSFSCFSDHSIFLDENDHLFVFGNNHKEQLGNGNSNDVLSPTKLIKEPNIKSIVLGMNTSFYLKKDGDLFGCGDSSKGQLGCSTGYGTFTKVMTSVSQVFSSEFYTLIQKTNGKIYYSGKLSHKSSTGFTELPIDSVESFSGGLDHCVFLKKNGEVWMFGSNKYGQCGFDTEMYPFLFSPTKLAVDHKVIAVACGAGHTAILAKDNLGKTILLTIGRNDSGMLGNGNTKNQDTLQEIKDFPNIVSIHCGYYQTYILLATNECYCTGYNYYGQLCLSRNLECEKTFQKVDIPDIIAVTPAYSHTIFVNKNKEIFVGGRGANGALGIGSEPYRQTTPTKIEFKGIKMIHNTIIP